MAVTLREVAREAGVSAAAVSKVLHGSGTSIRVSDERAAHIRQIAKKLDYRPNALARNLRSSRTRTIGLIWENFVGLSDGPLYFAHLLDGIGSVVLREHYRLTILPELHGDDILAMLGDGQLEGVIWCKLAREPGITEILNACPIPVVAMNAALPCEETRAHFVACDNEAGLDLAVQHLYDLGHRRFMFLREGEEQSAPDCVSRRIGFEQALARRGLPFSPDVDIATWGWNMEGIDGYLASDPPHTAIIGWSERVASKFLSSAAERGVRIPDRFSVVGFDSTQFCDTTKPSLTAVRQPIRDMAAYATQRLLNLIAGETFPVQTAIFPCTLDVRDSTAHVSPRS